MASIQEIMLQLEGQKSPFINLLEGAASGFQNAQNDSLNNARTMLLMEEKRRQMQQQQQLQEEAARAEEQSNQAALRKVGGDPTAVLPRQKYKKTFELGPTGYTKKVEEVADDTAVPTLDQQLSAKVARGELTIEQAYRLKSESSGMSQSLIYQMTKDQEKKIQDEKGRVVPGWVSTGQVTVDDTEARKMREGSGELASFNDSLTKYKQLIQAYGTSEPTDRRIQGQMIALAKDLQLRVKNLAQLGVLSASDVPFIEGQIPEPGMFKTSAGSLGALDQAGASMTSRFEEKMKANGYVKAGAPTGGGTTTPPPASGGAPAPKGKTIKVGRFEVSES